ncbi:MAG: carbon storage regulator [Firmicutes bacterium]|nr:carbon storage regulator [Bacillota bacterium]
MLTLGRKPGEYVVIGGNIIVKAEESRGLIRISIDAPKDITIVRGEVYEQDHPMPSCFLEKKQMRM